MISLNCISLTVRFYLNLKLLLAIGSHVYQCDLYSVKPNQKPHTQKYIKTIVILHLHFASDSLIIIIWNFEHYIFIFEHYILIV